MKLWNSVRPHLHLMSWKPFTMFTKMPLHHSRSEAVIHYPSTLTNDDKDAKAIILFNKTELLIFIDSIFINLTELLKYDTLL